MKALINLKHIEFAKDEAERQFSPITSKVFNWPWQSQDYPEPAKVMHLMKAYFQAKNLLAQLQKLHEVCHDFAIGEVNKYQTVGSSDLFDPFYELQRFFNDQSHTALPANIRQYFEFQQTLIGYAESQIRLMDVIARTLEKLPGNHEPDKMIVEKRLKTDVEVENCLVHYDAFVSECQRLIKVYQPTGNIQDCALDILLLFATEGTPEVNTSNKQA